MSNRLLVTSEYNFKSGYNTLLSTILEESIKRNVVIIPKYYHKPEIEFSSFFESYPSRNGLEKELLLFPPFVYPDDGHPLLHIFNGKNKSLFTMWEATRIGDFYIDKINMFDQIIVPNNWNKESFEQQGCTSKISDNENRKFLDNKIVYNTHNLNKQELKDWYCSNDVFVSAVSAEGWGLMQHESMACGRPVIVARYAGLKEFVTLDNSFCLRHTEVDSTGFWEYPGGKWSKYDEEHMIETMRYCYHNRDEVKQKGKLASIDACKLTKEKFIENLLNCLGIDF